MTTRSATPTRLSSAQGTVNLGDIRTSITGTRSTFTRVRRRREITNGLTDVQAQPDFITLISLICSLYQNNEEDLVPIQHFHPDAERYEDGGHTCVVSQRSISTTAASNAVRGTTDDLAADIVVKRVRDSVLGRGSSGLKSFCNEVRIRTLPSIRGHPNIVVFKGIGWDLDEADKPRPLLLEELAPQRSLESFWKNYNFVRMTFQSKIDLSLDVADGLAALHASGIVHGDVKPDNVLIFPRIGHQDAFMAKLTDFGHSVSAHENLKALPAFTPQWSAPEVLEDKDLSFEDMKATDVYSFGLVTVSIMIGRSCHRVIDNYEDHKKRDRMPAVAMTTVEIEDRLNQDSDFELDVLHLLFRDSLKLDSKRRSLRSCRRTLLRSVA